LPALDCSARQPPREWCCTDERDRDLLEAVAECARFALAYARDQGPDWGRDQKTVDAIAKRVEEIGELAKRVAPDVLASIRGVDWKGAKAFREILSHAYGRLDLDVLADVVEAKLPGLLAGVEEAGFRRTLR
jgi:uncharacterized protein with HEPN domain